MAYKDTLAQVTYDLERESAFSYQCNGCMNCCHNKAIRVAPYEMLRLARRLGISTTDFIKTYTGTTAAKAKLHELLKENRQLHNRIQSSDEAIVVEREARSQGMVAEGETPGVIRGVGG